MNTRLIEAEKFAKEGDKSLKTGIMKWNKDYSSAAMNYDEAAKLYRLAKDYSNAKRMYEKLIAVNEKLNDYWAVARNYEAIILLTVDQDYKTEVEELVQFTNKAHNCFKLADSQQNYVTLSGKVCKYLEKGVHFIHAEELYEKLISDLEETENYYIRNEVLNNYISLLVTMTKFAEVAEIYEHEIETLSKSKSSKSNLNSMALSLICIYLIIGDIDKADSKLQDFMIHISGFIKSSEVAAAEKLIDNYIDGNQQEFTRLTNSAIVNTIFPLNIVKKSEKSRC